MATPSGQQLAKVGETRSEEPRPEPDSGPCQVTSTIDMLEQQLRSLADMAGSLEPSEAKESTREVMLGLSALERDLEAAKEGSFAHLCLI